MPRNLEYTKFSGVGVTHKLCLAWLEAEGLPADMNTLAEDPLLLKDIIAIIRGEHESYQYTIDCDAEPEIPWQSGKIVHHVKQGRQKWSESMITLIDVAKEYGAARLRNGVPIEKVIRGMEFGTSPNSCVLEFLDRHPGVVPKAWEKYRRIFFFSTRFELTGWAGEGRTTVVVPLLERKRSMGTPKWSSYWERIDEWVHENDAIAVLKKD